MSDRAISDRYAGDVPDDLVEPNDVVGLLLRHRSVRRFLPEPVSSATTGTILAAAQSAATASNLQAWSVIEIRDPKHKDAVATLSGDQAFIRQAPVFFVFIADWARNRGAAEDRALPTGGTEFLESTLAGFVDAALAAQNAVVAAESLGLGTVYVGSVRNNPEQLADLLELPQGAFPVVGLALGVPDPAEAASVKPRLPQRLVRHAETYRQSGVADVEAYDARVAQYYAGFGAARGWLDVVLRRVSSVASLHGRHRMRAALERRGLPSR